MPISQQTLLAVWAAVDQLATRLEYLDNLALALANHRTAAQAMEPLRVAILDAAETARITRQLATETLLAEPEITEETLPPWLNTRIRR